MPQSISLIHLIAFDKNLCHFLTSIFAPFPLLMRMCDVSDTNAYVSHTRNCCSYDITPKIFINQQFRREQNKKKKIVNKCQRCLPAIIIIHKCAFSSCCYCLRCLRADCNSYRRIFDGFLWPFLVSFVIISYPRCWNWILLTRNIRI